MEEFNIYDNYVNLFLGKHKNLLFLYFKQIINSYIKGTETLLVNTHITSPCAFIFLILLKLLFLFFLMFYATVCSKITSLCIHSRKLLESSRRISETRFYAAFLLQVWNMRKFGCADCFQWESSGMVMYSEQYKVYRCMDSQ